MNSVNNQLQKLGIFLTTIFIFLLPTQFGKHFWPPFSYLAGIRMDYLSPTLFLNDLIILSLILIWLMLMFAEMNHPKKFKARNRHQQIQIALIIFIAANILSALKKDLALFYWLRMFEFVLLWQSLRASYIPLKKILTISLPLSVIMVSIIALLQFTKQQSLTGVFYLLGERTFSLTTPGISKVILNGSEVLRPYSIFPHPNALAGFLVVCVVVLLSIEHLNRLAKVAVLLSILTIFITFSQTNWLLLGMVLLWRGLWQFNNNQKIKIKKQGKFALGLIRLKIGNQNMHTRSIITIVGTLIVLVILFQKAPLESESFSERLVQIKYALNIFKTKPIIGVGFGNYLPELYEYGKNNTPIRYKNLQPVHNLPLLILVELGIVGLLFAIKAVILSIDRALSKKEFAYIMAIAIIVAGGLVDHYWLTIYQNQSLLVVLFALIWKKE